MATNPHLIARYVPSAVSLVFIILLTYATMVFLIGSMIFCDTTTECDDAKRLFAWLLLISIVVGAIVYKTIRRNKNVLWLTALTWASSCPFLTFMFAFIAIQLIRG